MSEAAAPAKRKGSKQWLPLESNPEVMSAFSWKLGLPMKWGFHDIYGTDPELLDMVPKPVVACLLLFPITEKYEDARAEQQAHLEEKPESNEVPESVFFTRQVVGNQCGTIGIIHSVLNNAETLELESGFFADFLARGKGLSPMERAEALGEDDELEEAHAEGAAEGQTTAEEHVDTMLHFVSLVNVEGNLLELDGRKVQPINHGATTAETFLKDAAAVCREFMDFNPDVLNFSMIALAPSQAEEVE